MNCNLKIGYVPLKSDLITAPGDYRRFPHYADTKGIDYEIASFEKVYDVVVVTQGADITLWRGYQHGFIIYDLIDSYLSIPRTNFKALFRGLFKYIVGQHKRLELSYWKTVKRMCARADVVICATQEQKDYIFPHCSKALIILDYLDRVVQNAKENYQLGSPVRLFWEGMPSNLYQLELIKNALLRLNQKYNIELHVATNLMYFKFLGKYGLTSAKKEVERIFENSLVHEWTIETISDLVRQSDIAIIPIDCSYSLNAHKPENKILFFWKMGIPVVVSNTPSYIRTMRNADLDFACKDEDEWYRKIESLIVSSSIRKRVAKAGKEYADRVSSAKIITGQWDKAFESVGIQFI